MASRVTKYDVVQWEKEDVATWASDNGLSATISDFLRQQEIDGDELLKLTMENLKIFGMALGNAGKLMRAVSELKGGLGE